MASGSSPQERALNAWGLAKHHRDDIPRYWRDQDLAAAEHYLYSYQHVFDDGNATYMRFLVVTQEIVKRTGLGQWLRSGDGPVSPGGPDQLAWGLAGVRDAEADLLRLQQQDSPDATADVAHPDTSLPYGYQDGGVVAGVPETTACAEPSPDAPVTCFSCSPSVGGGLSQTGTQPAKVAEHSADWDEKAPHATPGKEPIDSSHPHAVPGSAVNAGLPPMATHAHTHADQDPVGQQAPDHQVEQPLHQAEQAVSSTALPTGDECPGPTADAPAPAQVTEVAVSTGGAAPAAVLDASTEDATSVVPMPGLSSAGPTADTGQPQGQDAVTDALYAAQGGGPGQPQQSPVSGDSSGQEGGQEQPSVPGGGSAGDTEQHLPGEDFGATGFEFDGGLPDGPVTGTEGDGEVCPDGDASACGHESFFAIDPPGTME
ncbi:hypothetical protein G9272_00740 [Streptomyces asoensis]|uniref:Uncharacterized protein n=1 Tax=Streptomyces asoensis TaxID=249586 RepID=A0A6M4WIQ0_9ACTN|nr:hypothetical protein [Streptomyces asoensis]QJS99044.1 hypothetical protein G9272_00740 [Streptomyces asoensis]